MGNGLGCNHTPKVYVDFIFLCITFYIFTETVSLFALNNANLESLHAREILVVHLS